MSHAIRIRQTGGPEVLNWTAVDVGEVGPGQVRLRQVAAGLNYIDVYHRTGYYPQPLPFIPGLEGAGRVDPIAPGLLSQKGSLFLTRPPTALALHRATRFARSFRERAVCDGGFGKRAH